MTIRRASAQNDPGTPAAKMYFAVKLNEASDKTSKGNYPDAEKALNEAEALAKTLPGGGKARLEVVMRQRADLYSKWEGHAELLEKTNNQIIALLTDRSVDEMKKQYESLKKLETFPTDSSVAQTNAKLRAEAEVPSILVTAGRLNARKLYLEQAKFLERALEVERKLLGADSPSVCKIEGSLIDAYQGQRNFPAIRPLLLHICSVSEKELGTKPDDYIRALARLGQFDLDQGQNKLAETELKKALDLGMQKKVSKELQVLLMRSWADVLNQTNRQKESQEILKKADALEKTATDLPAGEKIEGASDMNRELYDRFKMLQSCGKRAEAKSVINQFILSFESFEEKRSFSEWFFSNDFERMVRHELYESVIFPVLLDGYRKKEPWSIRHLAKTAQNLARDLDIERKYAVYLDEFEAKLKTYRARIGD